MGCPFFEVAEIASVRRSFAAMVFADARRFGREDGNVELLPGAAIVAIRSAARQHSPRPRCSASVLISQVMRVMCDARDDLTPTWCSFTETSGGEPSARVVKRPSV